MSRTRSIAVLSALAVAAGAGSAIAAATDTPTTVTVGSTTRLVAGDRAPFDAPGVRAIRAGKPVPAGYVTFAPRSTCSVPAPSACGRSASPAAPVSRSPATTSATARP